MQDDFLDDILGRGAGDPDIYGYPGDTTEETHYYAGLNKPKVDHQDETIEDERTGEE